MTHMVDGGLIKIDDAAAVCKRRGMAYVIVFGVQNDGDKFHIATYGTTKARCKLAAVMGDQIGKAVLDGKVVAPQKEPYKGYDELLAAAIEVRDYARDSRTGRMMTGPGYGRLDAAIANAGVPPSCEHNWLAGYCDLCGAVRPT